MSFIKVHDGDGLEVLVNLGNVEAILKLEDGFCCIVFVERLNRKKHLSFYPMETYDQVVKKIDFGVSLGGLSYATLLRKEHTRKVKCNISLPSNRIAGYCPNCEGTVDFEVTPLIKIKGHRCSWCGQAIDLSGVERDQE